MPNTCKVFIAGEARTPKYLELRGDKTKKIESATYIIEFPGGAVEVSRCDNGDYWAHIIINRDEIITEADGMVSALGKIVEHRIDSGRGIGDIPDAAVLDQIAVRVQSVRSLDTC